MTADIRHCRHLRGLLSAFADGELPPERAEEITAHLSRCPDCSRIVSDYGRLTRGLREWADGVRREPAGPPLWPAVVRGIESAVSPRTERSVWRRIFSWPQPLWIGGVAAAAALAIALVLPSWRGGGAGALPSQYCRINSIAAHDRQVTIFQDSEDGFTVIWLGK
jgi:anti-sigma factor RsiW